MILLFSWLRRLSCTMHKGPSSHSLVFPSLIRVELGIAKKTNPIILFFLTPFDGLV